MVASYPSGVQGRAPGGTTAWDRLAPAYGLAEPDHFSQFGGRLLSRVRVDPSAAVLDLACGPGTMASVVARIAPSVDVVAVDLSVGMLHRAAREVAVHRVGRCAVAAMDAHRWSWSQPHAAGPPSSAARSRATWPPFSRHTPHQRLWTPAQPHHQHASAAATDGPTWCSPAAAAPPAPR